MRNGQQTSRLQYTKSTSVDRIRGGYHRRGIQAEYAGMFYVDRIRDACATVDEEDSRKTVMSKSSCREPRDPWTLSLFRIPAKQTQTAMSRFTSKVTRAVGSFPARRCRRQGFPHPHYQVALAPVSCCI